MMPMETALQGRRILVVEDDFLIALSMCETLKGAGATVLGPVGRIKDAVRFVQDRAGDFDEAVLDLDLHGQRSYPVADALVEAGRGFVFTTGFDMVSISKEYAMHPCCSKPVSTSALIVALCALSGVCEPGLGNGELPPG
jgi:CheY-like chemotaxis protein